MFRVKLLETLGKNLDKEICQKVYKAIINDDINEFYYLSYRSANKEDVPVRKYPSLKSYVLANKQDVLVMAALNNASNIVRFLTKAKDSELNIAVTDEIIATYFNVINETVDVFNSNSKTQMELMACDQNTPTEVLFLINAHIQQIEVLTTILQSPCNKKLLKLYVKNAFDNDCTSTVPIKNAAIKINNVNKILFVIEQVFNDKEKQGMIVDYCAAILLRCAMSILKHDYHDQVHSIIESHDKIYLDNNENVKNIEILLTHIKKSLNIALKIIKDGLYENATPHPIVGVVLNFFNAQVSKENKIYSEILKEVNILPEMNIFEQLKCLQVIFANEATKYLHNNEKEISDGIIHYHSLKLTRLSNNLFRVLLDKSGNANDQDNTKSFYQVKASDDVKQLKRLDAIFSEPQNAIIKTMSFTG